MGHRAKLLRHYFNSITFCPLPILFYLTVGRRTLKFSREQQYQHKAMSQKCLHYMTPLIKSEAMSAFADCDIYLKMESSQVTGSFKMRGIGHHTLKAVEKGTKKLIGCSGGNAGLALARAANILQTPCTIYVPVTISKHIVSLLEGEGVNIIVYGENFDNCKEAAVKESTQPDVSFIHPYDHPDVWEGNSTIVHEMATQLETKPSVIVTAVGGGGLLCGILQGLQNVGWSDVPVLAMETLGAHCFHLSMKANKIVPLENITSIAKTLGARTVAGHLMDLVPKFKIFSEVVSDAEAVSSCLKFAEDHRTVVEPSCGAALAAVYFKTLKKLQQDNHLKLNDGPAVIVVCGGSGVSLDLLNKWAVEFNVHQTNNNM